jgi:hypothetical protein
MGLHRQSATNRMISGIPILRFRDTNCCCNLILSLFLSTMNLTYSIWLNIHPSSLSHKQCTAVTASSNLYPEDCCVMFLQDTGDHIQENTVSPLRRPQSTFSPLWKSHISYEKNYWNLSISKLMKGTCLPGKNTQAAQCTYILKDTSKHVNKNMTVECTGNPCCVNSC